MGPIGTISGSRKDPNMDEDSTVKELTVWAGRQAGRERTMTPTESL